MGRLRTKLKPTSGFSHLFHIVLTILLPVAVFVLIRLEFPLLAIGVILLSKWRMFAVQPRHWLANIRANAVDIVVGLSIVVFMAHTPIQLWQVVWAVAYAAWLLLLKPSATLLGVSIQAVVAHGLGLMAVFAQWGGASLFIPMLGVWVVCYVAARHFFSSFDEPYARFLASIWGFFGLSLAWLLGHWLLFYGAVAQPTLLLMVIGFSLATLYYLDRTDRLSALLRRQFIFIMIAILVVVLVFSDWGDKAI